MKRFSILASLLLALVFVLSPKAAGPDEEFIRAYVLISEADSLAKNAQNKSAIQRYQSALNTLNALKSANANWKTSVINFRIDYVNRKLKSLKVNTPAKPTVATPEAEGTAFDAELAKLTINDLRKQVESLQNDLILKENKLKEALSAIPSADETKRLANLESDLANLRQENGNLKNAVDNASSQLKSAQTDLANAQAEAKEATTDLAKAQAKADEATLELKNAQARINAAEANASDKEIARLQKELADRQNELTTATGELTVAKNSVASLEEKLKSYDKGTAEKDLEDRSADLEKQLNKSQADLRLANTKLGDTSKANSDLEKQLKALEKGSKEKELQSYINSLEKRLAKSERANAASGTTNRSNRSFRDIFNFRGRKRAENAQVAELQNQIKTLRARLEILDAEQVPLTEEEKKLLSEPKITASSKNTLEAKLSNVPPGGVEDFKAGEAALFKDQHAKAEQKFMHVLKLDENNPLTLSSLAMAQMEQEKYEDAKASLDRAIKQNPDDPYALSAFGLLNFRQKNFEAARDNLARAAKLDPENAVTQHFLGTSLLKLNQPKSAETALRKAVQIEPGEPDSHYNLAVVYATQKPPFLALAKFHYDKAVKAGHPETELKKKFNAGN